MAWTSSKWGKLWLWSSIWPWRSRSIIPQNNRALNQGLLHLWSKFGDPSLNGWWVIARTNSWLTDTRTHTRAHAQATTIPEGQNWPRLIKWCYHILISGEEYQIKINWHFTDDILKGIFYWTKIIVIWFKFHWSLFTGVQLTIFRHWFRQRIGIWQAHLMSTNDVHGYWCICVTSIHWVNTLRPKQNGRRFQTTFANAFSWMRMNGFW